MKELLLGAHLSPRDQRFINLAMEQAALSTSKNRHGALVVRGNRILARGFNRDINDPQIVSQAHVKLWCSIHAEIACLDQVKDAAGSTIYVARVNRKGIIGDSRPCTRCYHSILAAGVKKIVHT